MRRIFRKHLYLLLTLAVGCVGLVYSYVDVAQADSAKCKVSDNTTIASDCYKTNFQIAQKAAKVAGGNLNAGDFQTAVQQCADVGILSGDFSNGTILFGNNDTGSCSNAVASCMSQEGDYKACLDPLVTAPATNCTTDNGSTIGDAGPGNNGTSGCGWNYIIEKTGKYKSNKQTNESNISDIKNAGCKTESESDDANAPAALAACQKKIDDDVTDCYNKQGGMNANINQTVLRQCLTTKAGNGEQCSAYGGSWIPAGTPRNGNTGQVSSKDECTPKDLAQDSSTAEPCKDHGGGQPDANGNCPDGSKPDEAACLQNATQTGCAGTITGGTKTCGQASTNIIGCGDAQGATALNNVLRIFVIVLTFGVGIAATGSIAYSAIRYAGARDNQSDVSLARERIRNVVIGLLLYGFLIAIANWLVPGGIF